MYESWVPSYCWYGHCLKLYCKQGVILWHIMLKWLQSRDQTFFKAFSCALLKSCFRPLKSMYRQNRMFVYEGLTTVPCVIREGGPLRASWWATSSLYYSDHMLQYKLHFTLQLNPILKRSYDSQELTMRENMPFSHLFFYSFTPHNTTLHYFFTTRLSSHWRLMFCQSKKV